MKQIYQMMKLNKIIQNHRIKLAGVLAAHLLNLRHLFIRFDPIEACNLRCRTCYWSNEEHRRRKKGQIFKPEEIERIASMFFPKTMQLVIGCQAEPTTYKNFTNIVRLAKQQYRVPFVGFTTNGQLLKREHIEEFIEYGLDELTMSVHGVKKETYEHFMVRSSHERFHEVLQMVDEEKGKKNSSLPALRLNYTANNDNVDELMNFFEVYGKYNIDTLQVRPVGTWGGDYNELLQEEVTEKYDRIVDFLSEECRKRGITFLFRHETSGKTENYSGVVLNSVYRLIVPEMVWRKDFDWREETYDEFCKRIGWAQYLWYCINLDKKRMLEHIRGVGASALRYDIS